MKFLESIAANDRKRPFMALVGAVVISAAFLWLFLVFWVSRGQWRRWIDHTAMAAAALFVLGSMTRYYLSKRRR
jgi:hypothetical protein